MARTQITENQEVPDTITDSNVASNAAIQLSKLGTGNLTLINDASVIFQDTEGTAKTVTLEAPTTITTSYTLKWPIIQGAANSTIQNDGSGNLSFTATPTFTSETLTATTNQLVLGTTHTITISSTAPSASRTYTIPDTAASSSFVMTDLAQTINGIKTFTSELINTASSGNTLVVDTSTLVVDATDHFVGIGTSSPIALLHVGSGSTSDSQNPAILLTRTISGTSNYGHGIQDFTSYNEPGLAYGSYQSFVTLTGTSGQDHYYTLNSVPIVNFTSPATLGALVGIALGGTVEGSSTVTTNYGVQIADLALGGSGSVGTNYGLYVATLSAATTNWGVFVNQNKSFLGGDVIIGVGASSIDTGAALQVNQSATNSTIQTTGWSSSGSTGGLIELQHSKSNTVGTQTALTTNDRTGQIGFLGSDGSAFQLSTFLTAEVDASVSSGIVPGRLLIRTTNTSGALTEAVRVDSSQKTTLSGSLTITPTTNQLVLGTTNTTTISAIAPAASRTYTLPDAGGSANIILSTGTSQTISGLSSINSTFIGLGRNRVFNGACRFDQNLEGGTYTAGTLAHYTLDQWRVEATGTPKFSIVQSSTAPTGFQYSVLMTTTVSGTPATNDGCNMEQTIEGPMMSDLLWGTASAVTATLSFWAQASVTGTYSISFTNNSTNRSYVSTYVVSTANTWTKYTVTVPGDTTGTWTTVKATFGLKIVWDTGSGSSVTTSTLNAWQAGALWKASGSVSLVANASATLYLTGVQFEIGSQATAFEFLPYSYELHLLQRYFWKSIPQGSIATSGQGTVGALMYIASMPGLTAGGGVGVVFPVEMEATPGTINLLNPITPNANWFNVTQNRDSGAAIITSGMSGGGAASSVGMFIQNPQLAADNAGDLMVISASASAQLGGA